MAPSTSEYDLDGGATACCMRSPTLMEAAVRLRASRLESARVRVLLQEGVEGRCTRGLELQLSARPRQDTGTWRGGGRLKSAVPEEDAEMRVAQRSQQRRWRRMPAGRRPRLRPLLSASLICLALLYPYTLPCYEPRKTAPAARSEVARGGCAGG
jgi:hypothetical protein